MFKFGTIPLLKINIYWNYMGIYFFKNLHFTLVDLDSDSDGYNTTVLTKVFKELSNVTIKLK